MIWLLQSPVYWRIRSLRRRLMLAATWRRVRLAGVAEDQRDQIGILRQIAWRSLPGVVVGGLIVLLVQVLANVIGALPSDVPASGFIAHLKGDPGSAYDSLLATVPTIAGVLLGLYYGAQATLIGSRYGRVPAEIRSLVSSDPFGTTYSGLLALAMGASLFLLGLHASGAVSTRLHAYALLGVSLVALYGFSALGRRVFEFLDPSRLVVPVVPDFLRSAREATTRGYRYETEEYQALYQRQASYRLDLLELLFELSRPEEGSRGQRLVDLARYIPMLMRGYLALKPEIPSASRWFPRTARQRRWYLADYIVLEIALATRTSLQFEEGIDTNWVEERLLGFIEQQITSAAERQEWQLVADLLGVLGSCNRALGRVWSTTSVKNITDRIEKDVLSRMPVASMPAGSAFAIALATDFLSLSQLELLLGFGERVREIIAFDLASEVARVDWSDRKSIYRLPMGFAVGEGLESFRSKFAFERDVHGWEITPDWYLSEELTRQLLWALTESIEPLIKEAERGLPTIAGDPTNVERAQILGSFASRKAEYVSKLAYLIENVNELIPKLKSFDKSHDRTWPEWDQQVVTKRIAAASNARVLDFATLIPALALVPPGPDRVDHFGQAVSLAGEECLRALIAEDHEQFQRLFPRYFNGCLAAAEQISREKERWPSDTFVALYGEALLDLMTISGYALVFAELRQDHRSWIFAKKLWSKFIEGELGKHRVDLLMATYEYHKSLFAITARSVMRTGWHQRVDAALAVSVPHHTVYHGFISDERPKHRSPLIRAIWPGMLGSFFDGQDVFVSCVLRRGRERPDSDHLHDSIEIARKHPEEAE